MSDASYHGIWRLDWGLGNSNKTAALIATLMIVVWLFAYIRKWGFWVVLPLFTGLGICLIHTFSRGGVIALIAGSIPILLFASRPWPWTKIVSIIISASIMIGVSICLDASERYGQGLIHKDKSITNRLDIWKAAPQMMVDAPYGWGVGNSGNAYMEWYQPLNRSEEYRTLVNSHLTWLVEIGWFFRFLYILSWLSILLLCWPNRNTRILVIPLGVWTAFAVAATFSSVAESIWLWIVPVICLFGTFIMRFYKRLWPESRLWGIPLGGTCVALLCLFLLGKGGTSIHAINGGIVLGNGTPDIWIVADNKVMGKNYGQILRRYLSSKDDGRSSIGIVDSAAKLPVVEGRTVVLAGTVPDVEKSKGTLGAAKRILLLDPFFFPQQVDMTKESGSNVTIIFGNFSQSPAANGWQNVGSVQHIDGVGDFIPHWPELVLGSK